VQKSRNAVLTAVCDADQELANRFGGFYDAGSIYLDYDRMLADPAVEAIIIGIADAFHVPAALKVLAAGKHVLCEKPIGVAVEEVEQLAAAVSKSGRVLQIGHMLRFDPGVESVRDFISTRMGEMLALKARYCDSTHRYSMTNAVQPMPRTGSKVLRPGGDAKADKQRYYMLAHGSHLVDLARHLGGPIRAVQARLNQRFGAHCWFVDVDFVNGAIGHLDLTIGVRMDWHEGFQIYEEKGSAAAKIYNPWFYKSSDVELFHEDSATTTRVLGADGVASIRTMVAIARSVASGKSVEVDSAKSRRPKWRPQDTTA
jgi:predicted dehydrogenase